MSLKELKKWIIWIVVILALGIAILFLRCFVIDKDFSFEKNKDNAVSKADTSNGTTTSDSSNDPSKLGNFVSDVKEGYNDAKADEKEYSENSFDDRILMYEGVQASGNVKSLIELMITDADDNFYAKPTLTMGDKSIVYEDSESYKANLNDVKNSIENGTEYTITFKYSALHAVVKEVVVAKK